jgi:hypothetical protein
MHEEIDFYIPEEKCFGETISELGADQKEVKGIIISGFPYDEGTKRNGGRVGGAVASTIFRKTLAERDFYSHESVVVYDSKDIPTEL